MDVPDCDQVDIWDYKPLKRKRKIVCTSTSIKNLPIIHQRPRNNSKSHGSNVCSAATNDESSSSIITTQNESGQNEDVICISPSISPHKSPYGPHHKPSTTSNKIGEKNKARKILSKTHRCKSSTNESSDTLGKTPTRAESTKTNYNISESLNYCPICQISSAIFLDSNFNNIQQWFNHISCCLDKSFPNDVKECSLGINCVVQEEEHYRNFTHHSLARLRASLSPNSGEISSEDSEIKFSMTKEFIKERNNVGNFDSLPTPQGVSFEREASSETSSRSELSLHGVRVESDGKKSDIDAFKKLFSTEPFKTPKKNNAKSPAKSTPKKNNAKSPAKSTPQKKTAYKSPLLKDSGQQTLMYDSNKKELVLTPNKSFSRTSKPLLSPVHTPKKQVSSSMWESLSVRKSCPPGNNSTLLSALNESDSQSQSSVSNPSLQKNKSRCPFAVDNDNSDSVHSDILPDPMIMPSRSQQLSSHSPSKPKSDKSYVTALFLSSDSEDDDGDLKKERADPKSIGNFSDSEGDSSTTEPANNLDFPFPSSTETSSSLNLLVENSIEKAGSSLTPNISRTACSSELNSEYSLSDDELVNLDISEAAPSEKPSKNTAEFKTKSDNGNISSLKSNRSLPVSKSKKNTPSKMKFHMLNFTSPSKSNIRKGPSKPNNANSISNQMQLTSFFTSKTRDNQLSTASNVESDEIIETNSKPIVLSTNTDQKKTLSDIEKNPKPVMDLEQFKKMFNKKPPSKKPAISTTQSEPQMPIAQSVSSDNTVQRSSSCPFYKKIPDTAITVDAFKYGSIPGCRAYFLSHFHYDHYQGITKHFKHPIYCSQVTANLVKLKIGVSPQYLHPLPLYCPVIVEDVNVTLLDANHCPGAALILFKRKDGKVILHTGDFRADSLMEDYPALKNLKIHQLYLDTTYCDSSYAFPSQEEVLDLSVSLSMSALQENPKTLIVVGSYTIGKEKVFLAVAEAIKSRIGVTKEKKRILDCQENLRLNKLVSLNMNECMVHVVKMNALNYKSLSEHLARYKKKFDRILAFKPTGWTHSNKNESISDIKPFLNRDNIILYGLPYSEHSSFTEMKRFVQFVKPEKIIPTVNNGSPSARKAMDDIFKSWLSEKSIPINRLLALSNKN